MTSSNRPGRSYIDPDNLPPSAAQLVIGPDGAHCMTCGAPFGEDDMAMELHPVRGHYSVDPYLCEHCVVRMYALFTE